MPMFNMTHLDTYAAIKNNDKAAIAAVFKEPSLTIFQINKDAKEGNVAQVNAAILELIQDESATAEKISEIVHAALEGYAEVGNVEQVENLFKKYKLNKDVAVTFYAKGGHHVQVEALLKDGADVNAALHGSALGKHHTEVQKLLTRKGANKNVALYVYALQGCFNEMNALIAKGANKDIAVFGLAYAGFKKEAKVLLAKGASIDMAIKGFHFGGYDQEVRLQQFAKQKSQRNWRTAYVVLAAIFLTPISLVVSLPLWFRARKNELFVAVPVSKEEYKAVKAKRETLWGEDTKPYLTNKPAKAWLDEKTCILDKPQLDRFTLFTSASFESVQLNKVDFRNFVVNSKEESKKAVWGSKR